MLLSEHLKKSQVPENVAGCILLLAENAKKIKTAFLTHQGLAGSKNEYGEEQKKLDIYADELLIQSFSESGLVAELASEEQSEVIQAKNKGDLAVVFDPLDGSGCIPTNLAVGTILGIFGNARVLQTGRNMKAAAYTLYGPLTTLTYAVGNGVHEFVLQEDGNFVLRKEHIKIGEKHQYALGGMANEYTQDHAEFINAVNKEGFKNRFSGVLVADVSQILHYGGFIAYPRTQSQPQGKYRLLFECLPFAFIAEQAGAYCSTGQQAMLDVVPYKVSDRSPFYFGNKNWVELAEDFHVEVQI
jgi:fructose-1,6-bisphosphatase I